MAEEKQAKPEFKCKKCGEAFSGGRALGAHYAKSPDHDTRKKKPQKRGKTGRGRKVAIATGFAAKFQELLAGLDAEIKNTKATLKELEAQKKKLLKIA